MNYYQYPAAAWWCAAAVLKFALANEDTGGYGFAYSYDSNSSGGIGSKCLMVALKDVPRCAQGCFMKGAPNIGCSGTDFACQCAQQASLMAAIEGCVKDGCPSEKYQAVIDGGQAVCDCVKTCTSSMLGTASASAFASTAGSAAGSGGRSMTSAPSAAATSKATPCTTTIFVTVSASATAAATSGGGSAGGGGGGSTYKTSASPGVASSSAPASPSVVTAAATGAQAPIGMVAGVAVAIAFL